MSIKSNNHFTSTRVQSIEGSKSIGLAAIVEDLKSRGENIISMSVGEPDFAAPAPVSAAIIKAIQENKARYSLVEGILQLREAICQKLKKENGISAAVNEILVSNGSKQILYNIFQTILNPGDEVIIPIPYWVSFPESVKLAGGIPRFVKTTRHQLDLSAIEDAITTKTKAIIINSPSNPTGAIYHEEDLRNVLALAIKHNFYIISDEAYEGLYFTAKRPLSIASLSQEAFEQTLTVHSFSKTYAMTGHRIGYLAAHKTIIKAMNKLQGHLNGNVCTFAQYGAIAALTMDQSIIVEMRESYRQRRDLAFNLCNEVFPSEKPQGAFYLYPSLQHILGKTFSNSEEVAAHILKNAKVALLPSSAFGEEGALRISYACSENDIRSAFERIKKIF